MKKTVGRSMLKKSICLIAIFIGYQFLQMNTYSNESYIIELTKPELAGNSISETYKKDVFVKYVTNPFQYGLALEKKIKSPSKKVYSCGFLNELHLARFLSAHNPQIKFSEAKQLAADYIKHCKTEGINHDIAFAQMCLETGYLKFGGSVSSHQNNFCGLGAINKQSTGEFFTTKEIGVLAHVQHLKAYASKDKLNSPLVDNRFKYVERGSVETVYDLSGKWATDPQYGKKIEKLLVLMYSI